MPGTDYGAEGRAYPVTRGSVWAAGRHLLACSDLLGADLFARLVADRLAAAPDTPALVYADPPWGQGLLNSFRTRAGLPRADYRWTELYRAVAAIGHTHRLPVFVECSAPDSADGRRVPSALRAPSHPFQTAWAIGYGHPARPAGLFYAGPTPPPPALPLAGANDDDTPGIVLAGYPPGGIVIDPCAGRGLTLRHAERAGWTAVTNELHPARVSAALVRSRLPVRHLADALQLDRHDPTP